MEEKREEPCPSWASEQGEEAGVGLPPRRRSLLPHKRSSLTTEAAGRRRGAGTPRALSMGTLRLLVGRSPGAPGRGPLPAARPAWSVEHRGTEKGRRERAREGPRAEREQERWGAREGPQERIRGMGGGR